MNAKSFIPVKSAERVFDILEEIIKHKDGLQIRELGKELHIADSSIHALVHTMLQRKYLKIDDRRRLMLGTKFYEFASSVSSVPLLACAKPIMKQLKNKCNENVHLAVLEGLEVIYIAIEQTSHPIRYHMEVGTTQSAHVTGVGKMLLSSCSNSQIRELYQSFEFKKWTPTTICSTDDLINELEQIRKRGYSIDNGEGYEGSKCFAGPIYGVGGKMVASLSISIPLVRIDDDSDLEMIAAVKESSWKLSQLLMEY